MARVGLARMRRGLYGMWNEPPSIGFPRTRAGGWGTFGIQRYVSNDGWIPLYDLGDVDDNSLRLYVAGQEVAAVLQCLDTVEHTRIDQLRIQTADGTRCILQAHYYVPYDVYVSCKVQVTFADFAGDFAIFNGVHILRWAGVHSWSRAGRWVNDVEYFYNAGAIVLEPYGTVPTTTTTTTSTTTIGPEWGWIIRVNAKYFANGCDFTAIFRGGSVTPDGIYSFSGCNDWGCDDGDSCEDSDLAGATCLVEGGETSWWPDVACGTTTTTSSTTTSSSTAP